MDAMGGAGKRHLVLVRAGEKSLHRQWLAGGAERSWDLIVSWYGDGEYEALADERVLRRKGGKWDVIHAHFAEMPELLANYTHFWLPDDDIATDGEAIDATFALMEAEGLSIGQPALTPDSYFTYPHTLAASSFRLRYTSLVEVMMPCLTRDQMRRMLPHLANSSSGFGLDNVWARLEADNRYKAAIIDAVQMTHTRPVGKFLAGRLKSRGIDQREEGRRLRGRFGHRFRREFPCYGGVTAAGRPVRQLTTAWLMLKDYSRQRRRLVEPDAGRRFRRLFRFFYRPTTLAQLTENAGIAG